MDIRDTRKCNLFNLAALAGYTGVPAEALIGYYDELLSDQDFLKSVNDRISEIRKNGDLTKEFLQRSRYLEFIGLPSSGFRSMS